MSTPIQNSKIAEIIGARPEAVRPGAVPRTSNEFSNLLTDKLKLSGHAATRLQSRNIELGADEWKRVMQGVEKAASKGAKESLVVVDDVALVVSVKNRTVITAVDKANLKENVFTNIDSAVIV